MKFYSIWLTLTNEDHGNSMELFFADVPRVEEIVEKLSSMTWPGTFIQDLCYELTQHKDKFEKKLHELEIDLDAFGYQAGIAFISANKRELITRPQAPTITHAVVSYVDLSVVIEMLGTKEACVEHIKKMLPEMRDESTYQVEKNDSPFDGCTTFYVQLGKVILTPLEMLCKVSQAYRGKA